MDSRTRFRDDYDKDRVIGNSYRSKVLGGEIYTVRGSAFGSQGEHSFEPFVLVSIKGRDQRFRIETKECMLDLKVSE